MIFINNNSISISSFSYLENKYEYRNYRPFYMRRRNPLQRPTDPISTFEYYKDTLGGM